MFQPSLSNELIYHPCRSPAIISDPKIIKALPEEMSITIRLLKRLDPQVIHLLQTIRRSKDYILVEIERYFLKNLVTKDSEEFEYSDGSVVGV